MAAKNYEVIMEHIFRHEGGYVDHEKDPGGATNMGITIGTLRSYRGGNVDKADVKALTKAEAREIYRKNYWNKIAGDELPSGVDLVVMDGAVNSGNSRSAKWLQKAIGAKADGLIGSATLAKVDDLLPTVVVDKILTTRLNFLRNLDTWGTFGKGWTNRVNAVRALAMDLARADNGVESEETVPVPKPRPASRDDIANAQRLMRAKGWPEVGMVDGIMGKRTAAAIRGFQGEVGMPVDGVVSADLLARLEAYPGRDVSPARAQATVSDIKDATSVVVAKVQERSGIGGAVAGTIGAVVAGGVSIEDVTGAVTTTQRVWALVSSVGPWIALAAFCGLVVWLARKQIAEQLKQFQSGNHV